PGVGIERALAAGAVEATCLARDQRRREVEERRIALARAALAELERQIGAATVGRVALAEDRQRRLLQLRQVEFGKGQGASRRAERHGDDPPAFGVVQRRRLTG